MQITRTPVSRSLAAIVAVSLIGIALVGCTTAADTDSTDAILSPPVVNTADEILCSGDFGAAPNQYIDENSENAGLNIDIMTAVGEEIGVPVKFENIAFGSQIAALQAGRVDVMCTSTIVNADRLEVLYMIPYVQWGRGFLVPSGSDVTIDCPDLDMSAVECYSQLSGLTVLTGTGSVENTDLVTWNDELVAAGEPGITVLAFDNQAQAAAALARGEGDISYHEDPQLVYFADQFEGKLEIAFSNYAVSPVALAFAKTDDRLVLANKIKDALEAMKADGTYDEIVEKWNLTPVDSFDFAS